MDEHRPERAVALLKAARDMGNPTGEMTAAIGEPSELPDRTKQVSGSGFWRLYFASAYAREAGTGARLVATPFLLLSRRDYASGVRARLLKIQ